MSRQDSILTANPISWKCKKTLAIWSTPIISSILLRWALFLLDSRSLRAILWNKNPKCKKPLERFVLTDTTCGMAYLHHQGFWIETNSSRSMPISSLSRNHPAFTHWKSCFQLKFSQCCCNWTPPKCRLSAFMKCGSGQWSHRHHMPQTQKTHIGMTLRMSSCTLSPLG